MLEELVSVCYICHEYCPEKSTCECEACVHPICLEKFCSISKLNICTICKTGLFEVSTTVSTTVDTTVDIDVGESVKWSVRSFLQKCLFYFVLYFIMGVLGMTIHQLYSGKTVTFVYTFWYITFLTSSFVTSMGVIVISSCLFLIRNLFLWVFAVMIIRRCQLSNIYVR
jgi:hypothetical protein